MGGLAEPDRIQAPGFRRLYEMWDLIQGAIHDLGIHFHGQPPGVCGAWRRERSALRTLALPFDICITPAQEN
jgi:hypothetical protein